jgi:hypothetical protein
MTTSPSPLRSPHLAWDARWPAEFQNAMHQLDVRLVTSPAASALPLNPELHPWLQGTPHVALLLVRGASGRYYRVAVYAEPSVPAQYAVVVDGATRHTDIMEGWSPHIVDIEVSLDEQQAPLPTKVVRLVERLMDDRMMAMREPNIAQFIAASRDQLPRIVSFTNDGPERVEG